MTELCGLALGHFANEILQHLDALGPVADQIRFMTKFLLWTVLPSFGFLLTKIQIASLHAPLSCNPCSPSSVEEASAVDTQRTRHTTLLLGPVLASVRYGSIKIGKKGLLHSVLLHLLSGL